MQMYILPIIHLFSSNFILTHYIEEGRHPPFELLFSTYCSLYPCYRILLYRLILCRWLDKTFISSNHNLLVFIILIPTTTFFLLLTFSFFFQPLLSYPHPSCPLLNCLHFETMGIETSIQLFNSINLMTKTLP